MIKETVTCDGCGATKREVNHWFRAQVLSSGGYAVWPWEAQRLVGDRLEQHFCGTDCVLKFAHEQMEKQEAKA